MPHLPALKPFNKLPCHLIRIPCCHVRLPWCHSYHAVIPNYNATTILDYYDIVSDYHGATVHFSIQDWPVES